MLPKLLHKIWIGNKEDNTSYSDQWLKYFPDYQLLIWDNKTIQPYIQKLHNLLNGVPKLTFTSACDILRLLILKDHGGIYLDHDIEIIRDFRHLLVNSDSFLTFQYPETDSPGVYKNGTTMRDILTNFNSESFKVSNDLVEGKVDDGLFINREDYINNCFIATIPNSVLIETAIDKWIKNYNKPESERYAMSDWTFGPSSITSAANSLQIELNGKTQCTEQLTVFNRKHLHPLHGSERLFDNASYQEQLTKYRLNEDCYAFHHHMFTNAGDYISSFSNDKEYIRQRYSYTHWIEHEL